MTTSFAIALAQLNPRLGDVAGNCDRLAKARGEAAKNGTVVIVTPEMYLSGYPCDDLVLRDDFMGDVGLLECVLAQRGIDAINGMDVTHPLIAYNPSVKAPKKIGRNERVMIQSPEGESMFIKYKNARPYLDKGYIML